jgi:integrase/recombinase XerD
MTPRAARTIHAPIDPHETKKRIAQATSRVEGGAYEIPKEAAREILAFVESTRGTVSPQRTYTYLRTLPNVATKIGPEFLEPGPQTPEHFRKAYDGYAGWTVLSAGAVAVSFWKWRFARAGKDYPSFLKIRVSKRLCARKDESTVLTPGEVAKIVEAASTVRDKAFIATLYESGARIGEILGLRVGDVERSEYTGFRLRLPFGKTGKRTVPLFESAVPALSLWLRDHPSKADRDAPLWCGLQATERLGEGMSYRAWVKILALAAKKAGIRKPVNPHAFRHSRASAIAKNANVSTSVMESFFGWQHGSPMASVYVHLSGHEVEDAMARAIGVERPEAPKVSPSLPRTCGRCENVNDATSQFCGRCAAPLDLAAVEQMKKDDVDARSLLALLQRPRVVKLLRELAVSAPQA